MLIAKKLLAPILSGVLVAFLFIAVETIALSNSAPSLSPIENSKLKTPNSKLITQNHNDPTQNSTLKTQNSNNPTENSKLLTQNSNEPTLNSKLNTQNSKLKTPNPKLNTQNSNKPTLNSTLNTQNSINQTQNSRLKTQNSKLKTLYSKLFTQNYPRLNRQTDNMNVLFIGVDKGKLLACSVFSINYKDKYQAGAVFLPTYSRIPNYKYSLAQIYEKVGVEGLRQVLEKEMEIDIKLYYSIEREFLKRLESYIDPIYINNEKLELYNLFTMAVSPQDEEILGALVRELLKPGVFFIKLPRILLDATRYIKTDFKVTLANLKFHYNNIVNLDTNNIKKVVLPTYRKIAGSQIIHVLDPYHLRNAIYEITK